MARLTDADVAAIRTSLLAWFDGHARAIQFRRKTTPYGVLVAEVMAQQTQVSRVDPAWRAFMARFPTVDSLARAPTADVVRAWSGLGYNRRAVQLQRAAAAIVGQYGGRVPSDPDALQGLPGIGPYTARAVAAVAFGAALGAVDTNVRRVLGRVVPTTTDVQGLADRLVDPARPAEWTYALMDLGATICRPRRVECGQCPLRPWCRSTAAEVRTARSSRGLPRDQRRPVRGNRARPRAGASPGRPFTATSRWLRGRIVARLAHGAAGAWLEVVVSDPETAAPVSGTRLEAALRGLAKDGLIEWDGDNRARLPTDAAAAAP